MPSCSTSTRMAALRPLLLLLLALHLASSEECEGRGCSCVVEYGRSMNRFEEAVACLYVNGQKALFYPKVDEYSVLEVPPVDAKAGADSSLWLAVEGFGSVGQDSSLAWVPHDKPWSAAGMVAPFYTAVIHLRLGRVERVQWDSHCATCSSADEDACASDGAPARCSALEPPLDQCYDCYIPRAQCASAAQCVPRVYVAWLGTDARGNPCTSAGKVISRFRSASLGGLDSGGQASVTLTPNGQAPIPQGGGAASASASLGAGAQEASLSAGAALGAVSEGGEREAGADDGAANASSASGGADATSAAAGAAAQPA